MKINPTTKIYLPMAGMIVTAALAVPAAAQVQVPFVGTFQGTDNVNPAEHTIAQTITGTGTFVGQFRSITNLTVGPSGGTGTDTWTAANGDSFIATVVGSGEHVDTTPCQIVGAQPGDIYNKLTQIHTIIPASGTGRFAGAQGSFILTIYHDVNTHGADNIHATCGSFGTITLAGVAH